MEAQFLKRIFIGLLKVRQKYPVEKLQQAEGEFELSGKKITSIIIIKKKQRVRAEKFP